MAGKRLWSEKPRLSSRSCIMQALVTSFSTLIQRVLIFRISNCIKKEGRPCKEGAAPARVRPSRQERPIRSTCRVADLSSFPSGSSLWSCFLILYRSGSIDNLHDRDIGTLAALHQIIRQGLNHLEPCRFPTGPRRCADFWCCLEGNTEPRHD